MEILKTVIYSACVIGIVSTFVDIAAPQGSMKKQLDLIIGIILVLVVITPFMNKEFKIRLSEYTYDYDKKIYGEIKKYTEQTVLDEASSRVSDHFRKKLSDNGIKCDNIIITPELDEYNRIEIKKVQISSQQGDRTIITKLIKEDLPLTEVIVTAGDSS